MTAVQLEHIHKRLTVLGAAGPLEPLYKMIQSLSLPSQGLLEAKRRLHDQRVKAPGKHFWVYLEQLSRESIIALTLCWVS